MKTSESKHLDVLDYARAAAILSVLAFHNFQFCYGNLNWVGWFRDFDSAPPSLIYFTPLWFGFAGVAIFFVISGFCIHLSFQQQGRSWKTFYIRRFFRLYPAYFAALIFSTIVVQIHPHFRLHFGELLAQWGTHLFFVFNITPPLFVGLNNSFWSLAVEAQLYLIYPLLLFFVARLGWRRTMVILLVVELLIRSTSDLPSEYVYQRSIWLLANGPFGYWFSWSLGAWLADSYLKNEPLPLSNFLLTPFLWLSAASYLILPLNPFFFLLVAVTTSITLSKVLSGQKWFSIPELGKTCLKKISLWSYSIYLVHMPIIMVCSLILVRIIPAQTRTYPVVMLLLTALWPLIFLVSVAWHKIFELPGIAFGKRIIANVSSRNTAAKGSA